MKTPDEIKKALECCFYESAQCRDCPYYPTTCDRELVRDAREYIRQLEAELEDMTARYKIADDCAKKKGEMNEKLYAELSAVKAELDAAVADLEHVKDCDSCKYDDACFTGKKDCFGCHEKRCPCLTCQYEWRGVTKEDSDA